MSVPINIRFVILAVSRQTPPLRGAVAGLALLLLGAGCATTSSGYQAKGGSTEFRPKDGFYVTGMLPYHEHGQDDTIVSGGGSTEVLPELDPGIGWGFALGTRTAGAAVELNYQTTDHDASNTSGLASNFVGYNLDCRFSFRQGKRVQPLFLFGLGLHCITVEDGSGGGGAVEDAAFKGLGFQLGTGVTVHASQRVAYFFQGGFRWTSYNSVDGVVDGDLADEIDDTGLFAGLGITYTF